MSKYLKEIKRNMRVNCFPNLDEYERINLKFDIHCCCCYLHIHNGADGIIFSNKPHQIWEKHTAVRDTNTLLQ
jgi:hypothetical protein